MRIILIGRVDHIVMSCCGDFSKKESNQNGVFGIFKSWFAFVDFLINTSQIEEGGDLGAPAQEVFFGKNQNGLYGHLQERGVYGVHLGDNQCLVLIGFLRFSVFDC